MDNIEKTMGGIANAIYKKDSTRLRSKSIDLSKLLLECDVFPERVLSFIVDIVRTPQFLGMRGSYILLNVAFDDLIVLSNKQKKRLIDVLEEIYREVKDATTCMVILEIIIGISSNEMTLVLLRRLKTAKSDTPRAMIAYGLAYFIDKCHDNSLIQLALSELMEMRNDHSEIVRNEVEEMLQKIKKEQAQKR